MEKSIKNMPVMNDNLKIVTYKINYFQNVAKNSIIAISLILADISEKPNEYFKDSDFTKIADYAESVFGYKKAYTYKLIKISKFVNLIDNNGEKLSIEYLLDENKQMDLSEQGRSMIFDVLKDSDGFEYSTSQMLELIPLTAEQITENINALDSSLSCKELRAVVKDIVSPPIEATASSTEGEEITNENTEEPEIVLTDKDRILQMLEITSTIQNENIKEKIIMVFQKAIKALEK